MRFDDPPYFATTPDGEEPDVSAQLERLRDDLDARIVAMEARILALLDRFEAATLATDAA